MSRDARAVADRLAELNLRGFDLAEQIGESLAIAVNCSQCAALVINGTPCHESGCRNATHECNGCNAIIGARQRYCEDCA